MGLSSSQARLLNLTARMHQIEYKAARLESMKLQMANESTRVYEDYLDALDKTKVQYKVLNTDGSVTYRDIQQYTDLLDAGYALVYKNRVYDGEEKMFNESDNVVSFTPVTFRDIDTDGDGNTDLTAAAQFAAHPGAASWGTYDANKHYYIYEDIDGKQYYSSATELDPSAQGGITVGGHKIEKKTYNYAQLCADIFGADLANPPSNVSDVITNLINSGEVTIVAAKNDGEFKQTYEFDFADYETSVSTNTGLQEVTDEVALKKAEAKYEADMKKIDMKDRKYDTDLAALDTERNAIKQEMDTLKTVAKENVERTFKLFG